MTSNPTCRNCGAEMPLSFVDLGLSAVANSYVPMDKANAPEPRYPLHVRVCESCWLVQLDEDVPADKIFTSDYAYFSSFSSSWLAHAKAYAGMMTDRLGLGLGEGRESGAVDLVQTTAGSTLGQSLVGILPLVIEKTRRRQPAERLVEGAV